MDFIENINKETIIICSDSDRDAFLRRNKLVNIKVMDIKEFIGKFCFDYDENTILYVMNKYNVRYEIALMYIKNLYYIEEKKYNVKKLDFLVMLKNELDNEGLLKYNHLFREYIKNVDVLVYGLRLGKFEKRLLDKINYRFIDKKKNNYNHVVYKFDTMESEIEFVAINICKLIEDGVSVKNIKLTNVDSSYYNTLVRIFTLFGLRVNVSYASSFCSFPLVKEFIELYRNNDLEYAIDNISKTDKLYDKLISVINKYIKYNNKDLLIYKLENTNIKSDKFDNGIEIVNLLDNNFSDMDYVFLLGFNDGVIPNSYKDIEYITDNIKDLVYLDLTKDMNKYLREDILNSIHNIKNLFITYKLRDTKKTFYPSSLCSFFSVNDGNIDVNVSYSEVYNKIKLTRSLDEYIKYGYKNDKFLMLYNNFSVDYNSYDNKYSLINRFMDKLVLSYSKMQIYNKCAFRYYLTDILKLDVFEENFSALIGSMVHYVMEKSLSDNCFDTDKYVLEFLEDKKKLNKKEMFFLEKYKLCINELIEQVILEREYCSFDNAMYEKKIDVDYGNNIKFTGVIDKILYKEINNKTYVALVDYKTGNDDISLKYLNYGLNMQLPIYLYLCNYLNLRNVVYSGFYLQRFNITDKDYRLYGYSNSDREILSLMDNGYDNSKIIKSMKTLKDGSFSKYTKVLNNDEIDEIVLITKKKINEVIENIKDNKFDINPKVIGEKNIGCDFCKFRDICFVKSQDKVLIVEEEIGGDNSGVYNGTIGGN